MIWMGEYPFQGPLEGVCPENRDLGPKMLRFSEPKPLPMARVMDLPPSKSLSPSAI
jgi:hypothetical protein